MRSAFRVGGNFGGLEPGVVLGRVKSQTILVAPTEKIIL
jgi:hypothetical protein